MRVPRHRLIRNLISTGDYDQAETEIRVFESDFSLDGPVYRYKVNLMVARAGDLGWSDWGTPEAIERTLAALHVVPPWRAPLSATA